MEKKNDHCNTDRKTANYFCKQAKFHKFFLNEFHSLNKNNGSPETNLSPECLSAREFSFMHHADFALNEVIMTLYETKKKLVKVFAQYALSSSINREKTLPIEQFF